MTRATIFDQLSSLADPTRGRLLLLLDERKGTAIFETVAQRLNVPEFRVSSIVTAVRKVLNVEGYAVISLNDGSKTITLNYELLRAQFDLAE